MSPDLASGPLGLDVSWQSIAAVAALLLGVPVGMLVRRVVLARLGRLTERTRWRGDDALIESLRRPLPVWFGIGGAYLAARLAGPPEAWLPLIDRTVAAAVVILVTLWLADLGARLLRVGRGDGDSPAKVTGVMVNGVRITVFVLGGLMLLSTLGISVTPILTTLGVGGLAVALGLQDTLANLFAGLHITLAGNLRVGDYVRLESGEEGYIDDIKWRATRIRTLPGNIVLIPNARLAQNIVTNYHLPDKDLAVLVQIGVHYSSDLERVEKVITDVARKVLAEAGGVETFQPFIRYHTLADSSINLTVILRAREFVDQYLLKHEFIKRVVRRFASEGIVIPYPIRALNVVQEGAVPKSA